MCLPPFIPNKVMRNSGRRETEAKSATFIPTRTREAYILTDKWTAFLLRILEVLCSNLGPETGYPG
jgi:hypothetical protein